MLTEIQADCHTLNLIAPVGGVVKDVPVMVGTLCVIPVTTADAGVLFAGRARGVFRLPKTTGSAYTAGQAVDWNGTTGKLVPGGAVSGYIKLGVAAAAAASADDYAFVIKTNETPAVNA